MKIQFENVDINSRSGPNGFGLKLARQLSKDGHELTDITPDARLSFIQSANDFDPTVLRLDGIYFNSEQEWNRMNEPIRRSYDHAQAIIVQSEFDKKLIFKFFGERENVHVIHNGTDVSAINDIDPYLDSSLFPRETIWMCASSWRPHKRLHENIRLFQHLRGPNDKLVVAGKDANPNDYAGMSNVHFLGDLTWPSMISWMKSAGHFIHLAWLDHCPNVIVDARMSDCKIYCSSEGGSREIAGTNAAIVREDPWKIGITRLYKPPLINDFLIDKNESPIVSIDIESVTKKYSKILKDVSK